MLPYWLYPPASVLWHVLEAGLWFTATADLVLALFGSSWFEAYPYLWAGRDE